jgi:hypothetical protein
MRIRQPRDRLSNASREAQQRGQYTEAPVLEEMECVEHTGNSNGRRKDTKKDTIQ